MHSAQTYDSAAACSRSLNEVGKLTNLARSIRYHNNSNKNTATTTAQYGAALHWNIQGHLRCSGYSTGI